MWSTCKIKKEFNVEELYEEFHKASESKNKKLKLFFDSFYIEEKDNSETVLNFNDIIVKKNSIKPIKIIEKPNKKRNKGGLF